MMKTSTSPGSIFSKRKHHATIEECEGGKLRFSLVTGYADSVIHANIPTEVSPLPGMNITYFTL